MKLFRYLIIYWTTKDAMMAAKIYQMIYLGADTPVKNSFFDDDLEYNYSTIETPTPPKVSNKKQEIVDSLNYLKNKQVKTKQDKESIYSLEMILKNMK
jgi:hypothetical protein